MLLWLKLVGAGGCWLVLVGARWGFCCVSGRALMLVSCPSSTSHGLSWCKLACEFGGGGVLEPKWLVASNLTLLQELVFGGVERWSQLE